MLTITLVLTITKSGVPFVVLMDASLLGLGRVLMQLKKVGCYVSCQLRLRDINYPTHDLQLDVVVLALQYGEITCMGRNSNSSLTIRILNISSHNKI